MEIKFKVWNKKTKCWVVPPNGYKLVILASNGTPYLAATDSVETPMIELEDCEVRQYIGIKDIKDQEIYNGNVVKTRNGDWGVIQYEAPFYGITVSATQVSNYTVDFIRRSKIIGDKSDIENAINDIDSK